MLLTVVSYVLPISALLIVLTVISRGDVKRENYLQTFRWFIIILIAWLGFLFITDGINTPSISIYTLRVALFVGSFAPFFLFIFAQQFIKKFNRIITLVLLFVASSFAILSITNLIIIDVSKGIYGLNITKSSILYVLQTIYTILAFGLSLLWMRSTADYQKDNKIKNQIQIITFGAIVGLLIGIAGAFLKTTGGNLLSPLAVTFFGTAIYFAIFRGGLFDARTFVIRALGYSFTIVVVGSIYVVPTVLFITYILHISLSSLSIIALTLITLLVAFLFQPLRLWFNKISNKIFYRDYYEPQDLLDKLSALLVGSVQVENIIEGSTKIINSMIKPQNIVFILASNVNKSQDDLLYQLQKLKKDMILTDDLDDKENQKLHSLLYDRGLSLVVRLRTTKEDIGFLALGHKRSGAIYAKSERRLIGVAADEIAISLQNAFRFQEIQRFNVTLQAKVNEATKELKKTNEKLKALDETKDDFISMASHQLRTPLSIIKGYVNMVVHGDAGKINKQQMEFLEQAQISSETMVRLVTELLNVSRITSGKFSVDNNPVNLADIVENEVQQLSNMAKERNIELTYQKPNDFPILMLDEEKIRQVVANFIDNAIHYSKDKGAKINVQLTKKENIIFEVIDNGIGVPPNEKEHLFTKFYRAKNAKEARPNGTGVGIYLAKVVISELGGDLIFESKEGIGSTFGFRFKKDKIVQPDSKS
jgi:signal transduction histidine kinase